MNAAQQKAWLAQWEHARGELERVHARELASLTADAALRASEALLSLANPRTLPAARLATSGLVVQQRMFHQRRQ